MSSRIVGLTMLGAAIGLAPSAHAQSRIVTFELLAAGPVIPPTDIHADAFPGSAHYFVDDYDGLGLAFAAVTQTGGAQGKVLELDGSARLSFKPTGIAVTSGHFDLEPFLAPPLAALNYLALDNNLYDFASILATPSGTLQTGPSQWNYAVSTLPSGFLHLDVVRASFGGFVTPQFALIGGMTGLTVDNVNVSLFPEPSSLAVAAVPALLAALRRRSRQA
jgi:hypothetical protein